MLIGTPVHGPADPAVAHQLPQRITEEVEGTAAIKQNIRGFIEELNNSWMLDLLNKHKVKRTAKLSPAPAKKKQPAASKIKPERRKQGLMCLNKELLCLNALADNLHSNFETHQHRDL